MPNKLILSSILLLALCFLSCKEDVVEPIFYGGINGIVQDSESKLPLSDVIITTNPSSSSIQTDSDGKFSFTDLEVNEYSLSAEKEGYVKKTISVNVKKNANTSATIILSEKSSSSTNTQPSKPNIISPSNAAEDQNTTVMLSWNAIDDDKDTLYYDVYLFSPNSEKELVASKTTDTSIVLNNLEYSTTYYWQVIVDDLQNEKVNGDVWSFETKAFPDYPIIFTSNKSGNYDIYSSDIDTTNQEIIQLTKTNGNEFWPRFNPTRNLIAYVNNKDIDKHIYTMSLDGKDVYKVTQLPLAGLHNNGIGICWSKDGNEIYYSNYNKLYRINKDGTNLVEIATAPQDRNFREIDISSTGDKITVLTVGQSFYDSEIYILNSDGTEMNIVVDNLPGAVENPIFSVDGKSIIYTHDASEHMSSTNRQLDSRIYITSLDSLDAVDLSNNKTVGTNDWNPRISPNGAKIIFENVNNDNSSEGDIMIMNIDGSNRRKLNISGKMPDWK